MAVVVQASNIQYVLRKKIVLQEKIAKVYPKIRNIIFHDKSSKDPSLGR